MIHCKFGDRFAIESVRPDREAGEKQQALGDVFASRILPLAHFARTRSSTGRNRRASPPALPQMDSSV
jgi:hypothetical protein